MQTGKGANMSARAQARALRASVLVFAVALAGAALTTMGGAPVLARLALLVPFYASARAAAMSLLGVSASLARRGARDVDGRLEAISDPTELRELRMRGVRAELTSLLAACVATLLVVVSP